MSNPFNLPSKSDVKDMVVKATSKADNAIAVAMNTDMTAVQAQKITEYAKSMKYGVSGIAAIICKAADCPYYNKCPLARAGVELPIGKDCPVETGLQQMWLEQFLKASGIDIEEMDSYTYDMLLLNDLSFYQLLETRATMELAMDPSIIQKTFAGYDKEGNAVTSQIMNPTISFKEKIAKMKMKILHELIATRRAKSDDVKATLTSDKATQMAEILRRVNEARTAKVIDVQE